MVRASATQNRLRHYFSCRAKLTLWIVIGFLGATLLNGCAGLPKEVVRPVSTALAAPSDTALGQLVQDLREAAGARHPSGFMLLSGPQAAYGGRLALVDAAQKTLDLQYYAIHADTSTERLLRSVVAAAQRGVRVRILLDDLHSTGRNAQVMRLAFVPNIEMRMFNPLSGPRNSQLGRIFSVLTDFSRVQQRMHNKLFIADNAMGVTGGRNLGDAYFGNADSGNFVDLDVLAAGPIVQELSRSFDGYWNNERAYPVQSLISHKELVALDDGLRKPETPRHGLSLSPPGSGSTNDNSPNHRYSPSGTPTTSLPPPSPSAPLPTADPTAMHKAAPTSRPPSRIWDEQPMDLSQARFTWAAAAVLVDQPAKIPADNVSATSSSQLPASALAKASPLIVTARGGPRASPPAAPLVKPAAPAAMENAEAAANAQIDTVVDGLLQLMGRAQRDLLIISPYFVPGPDMKQAFAAARARGVRLRILTNSLASNDAPIAHAGYARHRPELLAMGVELYEMRSELPGVLRSSWAAATGSQGGTSGIGTGSFSGSVGGSSGDNGGVGTSRAMLHSKLLIVDGRWLAIGSMNLDMRSQRQNTEVALLIRSTELSERAAAQIDDALREAAWRVALQPNGDLVWHAPPDSDLKDVFHEPDASAPLRLMLQLIGPFAPDHLL